MDFFNQSSNSVKGLLFINHNSINILLFLILSIMVLFIYLREMKILRNNYNRYYDVIINYKNTIIKLTGFLDTGNKLRDPYNGLPIILINKNYINVQNENYIYVPFSTVNSNNNLLKCIKNNNIIINGTKIKRKYLIGLMENINIDGIDCILNERIID